MEVLSNDINNLTALNQLIIDLDAVAANLKLIRDHLPPKTRIMAILKSSGYGIWDTPKLAAFLISQGIDIFGLAYTEEAVCLRQAGIKSELLVLTPTPDAAQDIVKFDLQAAVSDKEMIHALSSIANNPLKLHLHVNTGMNRLGCLCKDALPLAKIISDDKHLCLEGIMTHYCSSEDPEQDPLTYLQTKQFEDVLKNLKAQDIVPPWIHTANSSAMLRLHTPQFNMVRTGLALYGIPLSPLMDEVLPLTCALSLKSKLIAIHRCKKGDTISYGRRHKIHSKNALIGVIPLGYHDGIHRIYSHKGSVIIRGLRAPLVGTICMDQMMVDVSNIPDVSVGDIVTVFGEDESGAFLSPEEFARTGGTIAHELISCLGPRIRRVFLPKQLQDLGITYAASASTSTPALVTGRRISD